MIEDLIESMITGSDTLTNIVVALANSEYLSAEEKASTITKVMTYHRETMTNLLNKALNEITKYI